MPTESKRTGPVKDSSKETPQPRSDRDPRQAQIKPNPDRDVAGDAAEIRTIENTPGS